MVLLQCKYGTDHHSQKDQQALRLSIFTLHSHLDLETVLSLALECQIYSLNTCKLQFWFYKYSTETTSRCLLYKNNFIHSHTGKRIVNCCQGQCAFLALPWVRLQIVLCHSLTKISKRLENKLFWEWKVVTCKKGMNQSLSKEHSLLLNLQ